MESDYVKLNTPDFDPNIDVIPEQNPHRVEVSVRDIPTPSDSTNTHATGHLQNSEGRDQQTTKPILPQIPHWSLHSPTTLQNTQELHLPDKGTTANPHKRTQQQKEQ